MYTNYFLLSGDTTAVLDAASMLNDFIDIDLFIKNIDNAVCHYDSTSKKIYINLLKTKESARTNEWIKKFGKYFIYEDSREGIEDFHTIKVDPILKPFIVSDLISEYKATEKSISNLESIDSNLFTSTSYDIFVKFTFNAENILEAKKVNDYSENCYSYAFMKSIIDNNNVNKKDLKFYFFKLNDSGHESVAFIVEFKKDIYELYDYSTRPPRGSGGPFFTLLSNYFTNLFTNKLNQ